MLSIHSTQAKMEQQLTSTEDQRTQSHSNGHQNSPSLQALSNNQVFNENKGWQWLIIKQFLVPRRTCSGQPPAEASLACFLSLCSAVPCLRGQPRSLLTVLIPNATNIYRVPMLHMSWLLFWAWQTLNGYREWGHNKLSTPHLLTRLCSKMVEEID